MSILLARHGETPSNAARVLQLPDTPLSERGLAQHLDFRGKVNDKTDFGIGVFGIKDGTLNGAPSPGGGRGVQTNRR